jgi:hypothetical protein
MTMKPICRTCGTEVQPGGLLAHDLLAHPKAAAVATARKGYVCRQAKCVDVYGPGGHVPGLEGPHAR